MSIFVSFNRVRRSFQLGEKSAAIRDSKEYDRIMTPATQDNSGDQGTPSKSKMLTSKKKGIPKMQTEQRAKLSK